MVISSTANHALVLVAVVVPRALLIPVRPAGVHFLTASRNRNSLAAIHHRSHASQLAPALVVAQQALPLFEQMHLLIRIHLGNAPIMTCWQRSSHKFQLALTSMMPE